MASRNEDLIEGYTLSGTMYDSCRNSIVAPTFVGTFKELTTLRSIEVKIKEQNSTVRRTEINYTPLNLICQENITNGNN